MNRRCQRMLIKCLHFLSVVDKCRTFFSVANEDIAVDTIHRSVFSARSKVLFNDDGGTFRAARRVYSDLYARCRVPSTVCSVERLACRCRCRRGYIRGRERY